MTWIVYVCVWYELFVCVYDVNRSCVCIMWIVRVCVWFESFMCVCNMNGLCICMIWIVYMCIWHESLMCVYNMNRSCVCMKWIARFFDGYCSTVQDLLDWFEVDLGLTELLFFQIDLCVMCVFVLYSPVSLSSCPFLDILHCLPPALHESFMCVYNMNRSCVCMTWIVRLFDTWRCLCVCVTCVCMCVWHDSCICVTCLIHMRHISHLDHVTHSCVQVLTGRDVKLSCTVPCDSIMSLYDWVTSGHAWQSHVTCINDSWICHVTYTWHMRMCEMTHSYVKCDVTHSYRLSGQSWLSHVTWINE